VLGYAYGNRVTRCLAVDRPELVRSLLLLAVPGSAKAADPEVVRALADWTRDDATEAECIKVLEVMVGDPATAPSIWRQVRRNAALAREQSAALPTPPIAYYEGGGDKPLFIVQGLADRSAPPENARQLHDRFPARVHLVELPGVGHMPFLEQPETVADAVLAFLRQQ
jgi:pimeloyl-ACP methyl ester carboxylesterase